MDARNTRKNADRGPADAPEANTLTAEIARLPVAVRWIVILGERDGLSPKDIAALAGVSVALVEAMISRGLAIIQNDLPIVLGAIS